MSSLSEVSVRGGEVIDEMSMAALMLAGGAVMTKQMYPEYVDALGNGEIALNSIVFSTASGVGAMGILGGLAFPVMSYLKSKGLIRPESEETENTSVASTISMGVLMSVIGYTFVNDALSNEDTSHLLNYIEYCSGGAFMLAGVVYSVGELARKVMSSIR